LTLEEVKTLFLKNKLKHIYNSSSKESSIVYGYISKFYQDFRKKSILILEKLFLKTRRKRNIPKCTLWGPIISIPKPDRQQVVKKPQ
jgi:hypothetical protein